MHDVAVVGFGPVGALLANLLGRMGVDTVVLEREAGTYHLPRAVHFDDEVMRIFQAVGLAGAMEEITHASPGMRFVNAEGRLLIDWPRAPGRGPQYWHRSYRFHQPDLELVLREGVRRFGCVTVRTRCEVLDIEEGEDGARLAVVDHATGGRKRVAARFVVGCDGARSLVRRLIGGEMEDLHARQQWLVTDVILRAPKPGLGDFSVQHCNPARPATYVRGTGMRRRWEIMLMPGDDPAPTHETVWGWLAPWLRREEAEIERAAVYTFHAAIAREWRRGRLLLAGDAAHLTPPFLGQGMCAGMRDVANLAWKLRAVLGGAGDGLLDGYAEERREHVRDYIEIAVRLGRVIQETDPVKAQARDERMLAQPELMRSPTPRLGGHAGRAEPAGRVAPQPVLADGRLLDDVLGFGFGVLATADFVGEVEGAVMVRDAALDGWLAEVGARAVVVRPDRYVLGVADDVGGVLRLLSIGDSG